MTQPHPQRCYEIREDELIDVFAFLHDAPDFIQDIEGDIREHPCVTHTPAAPAERLCDDCNILELEEKIMYLEQQVKAAREQMLDELLVGFKSNKNIICWLKGPTCAFPEITCRNCIIQHLESLRGGGAL